MFRNKLAFVLSLVSGALLILSGTTGMTSLTNIRDILLSYVDFELFRVVFVVLLLIASFGGLAVFFGGYLVLKEKTRSGKFFMWLGSGSGVLSLVFNIVVALYSQVFPVHLFSSSAGLGVLLAVFAQFLAKNPSF